MKTKLLTIATATVMFFGCQRPDATSSDLQDTESQPQSSETSKELEPTQKNQTSAANNQSTPAKSIASSVSDELFQFILSNKKIGSYLKKLFTAGKLTKFDLTVQSLENLPGQVTSQQCDYAKNLQSQVCVNGYNVYVESDLLNEINLDEGYNPIKKLQKLGDDWKEKVKKALIEKTVDVLASTGQSASWSESDCHTVGRPIILGVLGANSSAICAAAGLGPFGAGACLGYIVACEEALVTAICNALRDNHKLKE